MSVAAETVTTAHNGRTRKQNTSASIESELARFAVMGGKFSDLASKALTMVEEQKMTAEVIREGKKEIKNLLKKLRKAENAVNKLGE